MNLKNSKTYSQKLENDNKIARSVKPQVVVQKASISLDSDNSEASSTESDDDS
jgi:hypothetical protein